MKVYIQNFPLFKNFSLGIEKNFKRNEYIEYKPNTIVFLFWYFERHKRVYAISDCNAQDKTALESVDVPVLIVTCYEDRMYKLFRKFIKAVNPTGKDFIYTLPHSFFHTLYLLFLNPKFHMIEATALLEKYITDEVFEWT